LATAQATELAVSAAYTCWKYAAAHVHSIPRFNDADTLALYTTPTAITHSRQRILTAWHVKSVSHNRLLGTTFTTVVVLGINWWKETYEVLMLAYRAV
jgi:hypothetical protein